jgi:hypothetical protein
MSSHRNMESNQQIGLMSDGHISQTRLFFFFRCFNLAPGHEKLRFSPELRISTRQSHPAIVLRGHFSPKMARFGSLEVWLNLPCLLPSTASHFASFGVI